MQGLPLKEFPCSAMTVPQASNIAQGIAMEYIQAPLNIFEMVELENEIEKLDLSDLII